MESRGEMTSKYHRELNEHWARTERRKWLIMLVVGTTAVYASRTSVPLLIPAISKERNWSRTDSGAVLSSFFWGYTLTQVIGGYLADKLGGQKIILFAAVGWSTVTVAMPIVIRMVPENLEFPLVILARIAHGAFQGAHFPGMSSLASRKLSEKDRAAFFSLATSGSAFGTLLTGALGSYILDHLNWQSVFYVIGALCCFWTFLFYQLCNTDKCFTPAENADVPWGSLFREPAFWSCVIAHACQNNCFFTLLSWLPTYFHDMFPEAKGWLVNMVPWVFTVPCTLLGKWISESLLSKGFSVTVTRKSVEALCLLSQSFGLMALDQIHTIQGALFCIVLTVGATGFHNSAVVVNPGDLAPKHSGSVFGLMNTVGSIPGFLGVYAAGKILETTHSWTMVFNLTAAVNILGCLLYIRFASGSPIVQ